MANPKGFRNPINDALIVTLLAPLEPLDRVALAVSGGSDSMALMHLAARWCALGGRPAGTVTILTVDHRLRDGSGAEARAVCAAANVLGFSAAILDWTGAKPATGLMAAAREARYRLMANYARAHGVQAVVTAHTEDDQAETFLLRLARGSGVDGLSAMRPETEIAGVRVLRPLLRVSRARLRAYLRSIGADWTDDPSNESTLFERVRIRRALRLLRATGITPAAIAQAAERLGRARRTLDGLAAEASGRITTVHPAGFAIVDRAAFNALPRELRLRLLSAVLSIVAGSETPPRLLRLEKLDETLAATSRARATLGGCLIEARSRDLRVYREPGRQAASPVALEASTEMRWDGRFTIRTTSSLPPGLVLAPLGDAGWKIFRASNHAGDPAAGGIPHIAAITTPAVWRDGRCIAAPVPGWCAPGWEHALRAVTAHFPPELQPAAVQTIPGARRAFAWQSDPQVLNLQHG